MKKKLHSWKQIWIIKEMKSAEISSTRSRWNHSCWSLLCFDFQWAYVILEVDSVFGVLIRDVISHVLDIHVKKYDACTHDIGLDVLKSHTPWTFTIVDLAWGFVGHHCRPYSVTSVRERVYNLGHNSKIEQFKLVCKIRQIFLYKIIISSEFVNL